MIIRLAHEGDLPWLKEHDRHVAEAELQSLVLKQRILLAEEKNAVTGWLRWGLFWDSIPFMNMLYLLEEYRGLGHGRALVEHWQRMMADQGYAFVLTSTQADESAQHFYRRLGYQDSGALLLPDQALEILLRRELP